MKNVLKSKRFIFGVIGVGLVALLVACGGGTSQDATEDADGQKVALHGRDGDREGNSIVTWTPASIAFSINPGARQDIPVTFTAKQALTDVRIEVNSNVQKVLTVSPESFASLAAGQTATVTLTVAPSSTQKLRELEGMIRVNARKASSSRPLSVKVTIVAPEIINGVALPPEPPPELNNATLAGFDTNGNGVRDDIDRLIATKFGGQPDAKYATAFAREYQATLLGSPPPNRAAALLQIGRQSCAARGATDAMRSFGWRTLIVNTDVRRQALQAFNAVLEGYIHRELPSCTN